MRKLLYLCLLFSLHGILHAQLFFWQDQENDVFGLHYDLYDICIDGGVCTGCIHTDVPLFINYIKEKLLPNQNVATTFILKRLLFELESVHVSIPYQRKCGHTLNRIQLVDTAVASTKPSSKPLSTDQKKEKVLSMLAALGYAKPIQSPVKFT